MRRQLSYIALSLASALLLALPFLFPVLFPLTWVSLLPLLWLIDRLTLREAFLFGWLTGAATNILGFYWLNYTIAVFGGFPHGVSELIFLCYAAYAGLPVALFAWITRFHGAGPLGLFPALVWVTIEFWFPQLFPWHLGNSQAYFLHLIQWADLVGPNGTTFLLVWFNTVLYQAAQVYLTPHPHQEQRKPPLRALATVGVVIVCVLLYGTVKLASVSQEIQQAPSLRVAAVQGDIDIRTKGNLTYLESNLETYKKLTAGIENADLVIWPESAVEAWLPEELRRLPSEIMPDLPDGTSFFLFGARSARDDLASPAPTVFNSAFLVDRRGEVIGRYHKQVLLAFGEYIPLVSVLSKLPGMPPIGKGFTPGEGPRTLDLSPAVKLAPLICYEDLMPGLSRRFVAATQANLFINLTNDAWFGQTVAPWQHANLARWRAIETRRALVRATNAGLTSVISPTGEILKTIPTFRPGVLTAAVPLLKGETLYVRFGDWFGWIASATLLCFLVVRQCSALF